MIDLIGRIRERLANVAYVNEAAISHGIVTPILNGLGWDSADPSQLVPEYTVERCRVDFALLGTGRKPAVFIEVKGVGLAVRADKQLFEYAFHEGVPLCVLTDGREWNFYLPGAQGSYDDRRVYRLQLDERAPADCMDILKRYLGRDRVIHGEALEAAQHDYRAAASKREAEGSLPVALRNLLDEPDGTLLSLVADSAEAISGFRPDDNAVTSFLRNQQSVSSPRQGRPPRNAGQARLSEAESEGADQPIRAELFGRRLEFATAKEALVGVLQEITARNPGLIGDLAAAVRGRARNNIARSIAEIHPERPDLARAEDIGNGWFVGLNLSNVQKMKIIRAAVAVYGLSTSDVIIALPNA